MKFNEIKKNKDPRVVKPRDPNFKVMQDIKKSGASGSHGDKTKEIPRKAKHKDQDIEESPIKQDRDNPIAKPYVDTPEWKALHDMDDKIIQAYNKHKESVSEDGWKDDYKVSRLLGKAQASMAHGLELAESVLKGDKDMSIIKARVIKENWPELIDQLNKVYDTKTDLNSMHEKEEMCPEACCGVPVSECNCPPDCPHCDCNAINETFVLYDKKTGKRHNAKDKKTATAMIAKNKNLEIKGQKWNEKVGDTWSVGDKFLINPDDAPNKKLTVDKIKGNKLLGSNTKWYSKYAVTKANMSEDLDSPSHKAQSSIWHKNNPIGRNFMDPDDYDSDAPGTHIIMDNPTELHFYKVPAKSYDEAFDLWLDSKGRHPEDNEYYDSTKDYASDHQYWGRIAPDEPEPDEEESLTNEQIAGILEDNTEPTDMDDYRAKIKTLYGLERYMKSDPQLAQAVKKRYRELAKWKFAYDKQHESDYASQIYDAIKTETATAGATSAGAIATVVNPKQAYGQRPKDKKGLPKAPQKKKADGTAVNALDMGNNLMGGAAVKR